MCGGGGGRREALGLLGQSGWWIQRPHTFPAAHIAGHSLSLSLFLPPSLPSLSLPPSHTSLPLSPSFPCPPTPMHPPNTLIPACHPHLLSDSAPLPPSPLMCLPPPARRSAAGSSGGSGAAGFSVPKRELGFVVLFIICGGLIAYRCVWGGGGVLCFSYILPA